LLLAICLLSFAACGTEDEDVPEGMHLVSDPGTDGYYLYLPMAFLYSRTLGGTVAYVSNMDKTSFSMMRVHYKGSITEYFDAHDADFLSLYKSYERSEAGEDSPYSAFDKRYQYNLVYERVNENGTKSDEAYKIVQLVAQKGDYLYIFTYEARSEDPEGEDVSLFDKNYADFESIVKNIRFTDKAADGGVSAVPNFTFDKGDTPAGMRLASDPVLCNYKLYLPENWIFDVQTSLTSGYVSDTDKTNVSMFPHIYGEDTYEAYWANEKEALKNVYGDSYTVTETTLSAVFGEEGLVMGGDSNPHVYVIEGKTASGKDVRVLRIVIEKGYYVFVFQYTAFAEKYDAHLSEVKDIIKAFRFKGQS
jgi:hypothetical protein